MRYFRAILIYSATGISSQCLEWDIAAQGKTEEEALRSLAATIYGQMVLDKERGLDRYFEGIEPPPHEIQEMAVFASVYIISVVLPQ
jgi:hypothetical protein